MLALLALAIGSPTAIYNAIIEEMRGNRHRTCRQPISQRAIPRFRRLFLLGICETQRGKLEVSLQFKGA